jgi:hypothetical protein
MTRLAAGAPADSGLEAYVSCATSLWRQRRGETASFDAGALRRFGLGPCAAVLGLAEAARAGGPTLDSALAATDSVFRHGLGVDVQATMTHLVLARAWEARGDLRRARGAAALRPQGFQPSVTEAVATRAEGRLSALLGDTTAAVRAYRRYLAMRRDAESVLVPQRDSVAAALARLERR